MKPGLLTLVGKKMNLKTWHEKEGTRFVLCADILLCVWMNTLDLP